MLYDPELVAMLKSEDEATLADLTRWCDERGLMLKIEAVRKPPKPKKQTEFDVILTDIGKQKIQVIKAVREITGLGLKEAKALVDMAQDGLPQVLLKAVCDAEVEKVVDKFATAGAIVEAR